MWDVNSGDVFLVVWVVDSEGANLAGKHSSTISKVQVDGKVFVVKGVINSRQQTLLAERKSMTERVY